jgi:hypothetical protein
VKRADLDERGLLVRHVDALGGETRYQIEIWYE